MTEIYQWSKIRDEANKHLSVYLIKLGGSDYIQIIYDSKKKVINCNIRAQHTKSSSIIRNSRVFQETSSNHGFPFVYFLKKYIKEILSIPDNNVEKSVRKAYNITQNFDRKVVSRTKKTSSGNFKLDTLADKIGIKKLKRKEEKKIGRAAKSISSLFSKDAISLNKKAQQKSKSKPARWKNVIPKYYDILDLFCIFLLARLVFLINFSFFQTGFVLLLGLISIVGIDYFVRKANLYFIKYYIILLLFAISVFIGIFYE